MQPVAFINWGIGDSSPTNWKLGVHFCKITNLFNISHFRLISSVAKRLKIGHSYYGMWIGNCTKLSKGTVFNDFEWPLIQILRSQGKASVCNSWTSCFWSSIIHTDHLADLSGNPTPCPAKVTPWTGGTWEYPQGRKHMENVFRMPCIISWDTKNKWKIHQTTCHTFAT